MRSRCKLTKRRASGLTCTHTTPKACKLYSSGLIGDGSGCARLLRDHAERDDQHAIDGCSHDGTSNHGANAVLNLARGVRGDGVHGEESI